jgi:hypothetical protein
MYVDNGVKPAAMLNVMTPEWHAEKVANEAPKQNLLDAPPAQSISAMQKSGPVLVPGGTVIAGYSFGMSFADFVSSTTLKDHCDKNCRKVIQRAESGQSTWFQTSKAKLCFENGKLIEIDADGKEYRQSN